MTDTLPRLASPSIPRSRTRLIGRARALTDLAALLARDDVPVVTITGPGGIGKTRLALALAADVGSSFPDGVHLVPLAPVRDPELVPSAVAQALGLREATEVPVAELVRRLLADRRALLVLDNVEHVVAAAPFVASVVDACPSVTVLATSRTRLRIVDEREYPLPPLGTPEVEVELTPESVAGSEAVRLFVERAQAVAPSFRLAAGNAAAVAEICRRLDGQPLAIELAAARVKTLAPAALLVRLGHSLSILVDGRRDAPARQRTLRDAIAWSYDLLPEPERAVLRRLAVFVGGFSLDAAEALCADLEIDTLPALASLVDQSLVQQVDPSGHEAGGGERDEAAPSHRLLETVREFGLEQLDAAGELDAVRGTHAGYFVALAERGQAARDQGTEAVASADVHLGNWRAVLDWARRTGDRTLAARLADALMSYWGIRCHLVEGRSWLEWILEAEDEVPADLRAGAEVGLGLMVYLQGDYAAAASSLELAARHFRASGDAARLSQALQWLGENLLGLGDVERARHIFLEALEISRAGGSVVPDGGWAAWPLKNLSYLAIEDGDLALATSLMEESHAVARATGQPWATGDALSGLSDIARRDGRTTDAAKLLGEALVLWHGVGDVGCVAMSLGDIAALSAGRSGGARAAVLFGAHAGYLALVGRAPWPMTAPENDRAMARLRHEMGDAPFAAAFDQGRRSPLAAAVELGRAEAERLVANAAAGRAEHGGTAGLSAREVEVVGLVAAGRSDQEIADVLFMSRRTASTHVSHILTKLGLANRAEAAAWAVRRGLA